MAAMGERIFRALDFLRRRKIDYQQTFGPPCGQRVLDDLAVFCRANETTFNADERLSLVIEGRRQVWLRIAYHLNMTSQDLYRVFNAGNETGEKDG